MVFNLLLVESSLEMIPEQLWQEESILSYCRKVGRPPSKCLLDRSFHHRAMTRLSESFKRGRPDIPYHVMLDTLYSPLYMDDLLNFYIQTISGLIIRFGKGVRPPRNYSRFEGLMVDLFEKGRIMYDNRELLTVESQSINSLLREIDPEIVIGLSVLGKPSTVQEVASACTSVNSSLACIGGFPHGHFSRRLNNSFSKVFSVSRRGLDASLVSARLVYEVEKLLIKD